MKGTVSPGIEVFIALGSRMKESFENVFLHFHKSGQVYLFLVIDLPSSRLMFPTLQFVCACPYSL